jgi:DNA invertase Pin-like site-specific DNA recombinase
VTGRDVPDFFKAVQVAVVEPRCLVGLEGSMTKQKGFTTEFEDEAVRLARTSGRTRRELAENLGVGLSTLTRWIARNRDREIDAPENARSED